MRSKEYNVNISPNNIALLQYTSGSTNNPKGVIITHTNIIDKITMISDSFSGLIKNENGFLPDNLILT